MLHDADLAPAYRWLELSGDGRVDSGVVYLEEQRLLRLDPHVEVWIELVQIAEGQIVTPEGKRVPLKAEIGVAEYR